MGSDDAARLAALVAISRDLASATAPDALVRRVLDAALELMAAEGASLARIDEEHGRLEFETVRGELEGERFDVPLGRGIVGHVVATDKSVIVNDVASDPRFYAGVDRRTGFETRSLLCVPLRGRAGVIGALEVVNAGRPEGFSDADLELLEALAGLAAVTLERVQATARTERAHRALREQLDDRYELVIGTTPAMREVVETLRTAAASRASVLLLGESGVGKEVMARAVHRWSPRSEAPFVAVNCVALTPELLESELFGHERGAFTGAVAQKRGRFELAHGGTLFLDEIGELAPHLQAKLLRALQEREIQRVGGTRDIRVDVRIVAATNRDLARAMAEGAFREDLFYRLNVVSVTIPPLRERRDDVPALAAHFVARAAREAGVRAPRLSEGAIRALTRHAWPGNVRELQNAIERAVVLARSDVLTEADFAALLDAGGAPGAGAGADPASAFDDLPLSQAVDAYKAWRIRRALAACGGNQTAAAARLGMRQPNLSRLMRALGIR